MTTEIILSLCAPGGDDNVHYTTHVQRAEYTWAGGQGYHIVTAIVGRPACRGARINIQLMRE